MYRLPSSSCRLQPLDEACNLGAAPDRLPCPFPGIRIYHYLYSFEWMLHSYVEMRKRDRHTRRAYASPVLVQRRDHPIDHCQLCKSARARLLAHVMDVVDQHLRGYMLYLRRGCGPAQACNCHVLLQITALRVHVQCSGSANRNKTAAALGLTGASTAVCAQSVE